MKRAAPSAGDLKDRNVKLIADTLDPLVKAETLRIPRGEYVVRRGRGKVIVERMRGE